MPRATAFTDYLYIGLREGRCVAMAWKLHDARSNAQCVREWVAKGLDVQTVRKDDAGPYWDQLRAALFAEPATS